MKKKKLIGGKIYKFWWIKISFEIFGRERKSIKVIGGEYIFFYMEFYGEREMVVSINEDRKGFMEKINFFEILLEIVDEIINE